MTCDRPDVQEDRPDVENIRLEDCQIMVVESKKWKFPKIRKFFIEIPGILPAAFSEESQER